MQQLQLHAQYSIVDSVGRNKDLACCQSTIKACIFELRYRYRPAEIIGSDFYIGLTLHSCSNMTSLVEWFAFCLLIQFALP